MDIRLSPLLRGAFRAMGLAAPSGHGARLSRRARVLAAVPDHGLSDRRTGGAPSPAGTGQRVEHWLTAGVVILVLCAVGQIVTAPLGNGSLVTSLTVYSELFAQAWDEFGFARSLGVPMVGCLGDTVVERVPYGHQAPAGWWPPYLGRTLFGKTEVGYKFFPGLFTAAAIVLLFRLARTLAAAGWAAGVAVLFVACPAVQLYGALPGIESISLLATVVFLGLWESWRRDPTPRRRRFAVAAFLIGTQVAWSVYLVVPGLLLAEVLRPREERRWPPIFGLFALGVLGFAMVIGHLMLGTRSLATVFGDVVKTATDVVTSGLGAERLTSGSPTGFVVAQGRWLIENLGPAGGPLLVVAVLAVLGCRQWRRDPLTRLATILLVQGVLTVVLFNARSHTHGYYWFLMAAPWALFLVQGARLLARFLAARWPAGSATAPVVMLAAVAAVGFSSVWTKKITMEATGLRETARGVDALVPRGDWVCTTDPLLIEAMLHSQRRWTPPLLKPEHVDVVLRARDEGRLPFTRLFFYLDATTRKLRPDLADHLEGLAERPGVRRTPAAAGGVIFTL